MSLFIGIPTIYVITEKINVYQLYNIKYIYYYGYFTSKLNLKEINAMNYDL